MPLACAPRPPPSRLRWGGRSVSPSPQPHVRRCMRLSRAQAGCEYTPRVAQAEAGAKGPACSASRMRKQQARARRRPLHAGLGRHHSAPAASARTGGQAARAGVCPGGQAAPGGGGRAAEGAGRGVCVSPCRLRQALPSPPPAGLLARQRFALGFCTPRAGARLFPPPYGSSSVAPQVSTML